MGVRGCAGGGCIGVHGCAWVWEGVGRRGVRGCAWVYACVWDEFSVNFQNFFWRIESLHQPTLIRILYEFLYKKQPYKFWLNKVLYNMSAASLSLVVHHFKTNKME